MDFIALVAESTGGWCAQQAPKFIKRLARMVAARDEIPFILAKTRIHASVSLLPYNAPTVR